MNAEFKEKFNLAIPLIPLKETGQIQAGNATRIDWNSLCPNDGTEEIYLIGNPPYYGSKRQTAEQKADYAFVFGRRPHSKNLNYIALWFVKGADYIEGSRAELAFVTTKTVAQGEHVGLMFPMIFAKGIEIGFAYSGFQWDNNAKKNADVTVAVIGLRNVNPRPKYLYTDDLRIVVKNINGYLADGADIVLDRRKAPLGAARPNMAFGSMPRDGGGLILSPDERERMIADDPRSEQFIKRYIGSSEAINDGERYCLWILEGAVAIARSITAIESRLKRVAEERSQSKAGSTAAYAAQPHRFVQISYEPTDSIIVPSISSGLRKYIPIGYLGPETVISNKGFAIYGAAPWLFALLTSQMHMAGVNAVSGRMRINYQYSNTIVYNNFPVPPLSAALKDQLTVAALRVLDVREYHCENTLAEMYDPDLMLTDLREAHLAVDRLVDSIYSKRVYETDEQRLSDLIALYEEMTAAESAKGSRKK